MEKKERLTQKIKLSAIFILLILALNQCTSDTKPKDSVKGKNIPEVKVSPSIKIPVFNADSAYDFIQDQVGFGPRVPNTKEHEACANYLVNKMNQYADSAFIQYGNATTWDNKTLFMKNIIAVFSPKKRNRILLSAHWDTRPWADEDTARQDEPIVGANDGGSGVGVLLEIARNLSIQQPELGIDIILFDAEDWGKPNESNSYCLGSQYWANNPHDKNYRDKARFGINLDMVGGKDAIFAKEGESMLKSRWVMDKVWKIGQGLGHNEFIDFTRQGIVDDHFYVNTILNFPYIDIINYGVAEGGGFGHFWHTHKDDMDVIDRKPLKAVGETVMHTIFKEIN